MQETVLAYLMDVSLHRVGVTRRIHIHGQIFALVGGGAEWDEIDRVGQVLGAKECCCNCITLTQTNGVSKGYDHGSLIKQVNCLPNRP